MLKKFFILVLVLINIQLIDVLEAKELNFNEIQSEYDKYRNKIRAAEQITKEELDRINFLANNTNSSDERNIKNFVLSTDIRTFKDIPENIDKEIEGVRRTIRTIIFEVATDIELSENTGKIILKNGSIQYDTLPEGIIEKYKNIMEAKKQNNISVRSVQIAMRLLVSVNKQLIKEAEKEKNAPLKRKLYITQAAYIYEMSDIVLGILKKIELEGKPVLKNLKIENENRINIRLSEIDSEIKKISQAKKNGDFDESVSNKYMEQYSYLKKANELNLMAWEDLMNKVVKQDEWLNKMKRHSFGIERKRNAAKLQLETLRDIAVVGEISEIIGNMDDLATITQDLELLELNNDTVLQLLFGTADIEPFEKKSETLPIK